MITGKKNSNYVHAKGDSSKIYLVNTSNEIEKDSCKHFPLCQGSLDNLEEF
mgnify:CR=1 FL=1